MLKKFIQILSVALILVGVLNFMPAQKAYAQASICWVHSVASNEVGECSKSSILNENYKKFLGASTDKCFEVKFDTNTPTVKEADCSSAPFAEATDLSSPKSVKNDCNDSNLNQDNCGILKYLIIFINLLSTLVGVVVVAMIIVGGIQYSSAGDDPQKVAAAKSKITNAVLALVVFFFMFAFLQWLVPGGIF